MKTMKIDELKQALEAGRVDALYDNRGPGSFENLHIKGAQQLSVSDVKDRLPGDVDAMLVFYWAGYSWDASTKAARVADQLGYNNVHDYRGGIKEWHAAGLPVEGEIA